MLVMSRKTYSYVMTLACLVDRSRHLFRLANGGRSSLITGGTNYVIIFQHLKSPATEHRVAAKTLRIYSREHL